MSTPAQALTTPANPQPENAPTPGLWAFHDFIRPGEEPLYAELDQSLRRDLAPIGILEHNLVDEMRRAMWRLRRCGIVEEGFRDLANNEAEARLQLAVDRARAQAHRLLHKCTAELRKLQTDRQYRNETFEHDADVSDLGLADWRQIRKGIDEQFQADYRREKMAGMAQIDAILSTPVRRPAPLASSFCKTGFPPGEPLKTAA